MSLVDLKIKLLVRGQPLAGERVLEQDLVHGSHWFAIGLKPDLGIDVLDLPHRVHGSVKHPAGLLLTRLLGVDLWSDMRAVQHQRLIREPWVDHQSDLLSIVNKIVCEEILLSSL